MAGEPTSSPPDDWDLESIIWDLEPADSMFCSNVPRFRVYKPGWTTKRLFGPSLWQRQTWQGRRRYIIRPASRS